MPVTYEIDPNDRVVVAVADEQATPAEMLAYLEAIAADPAARGLDRIFILKGGQLGRVLGEDVRRLADRAAALWGDAEFRTAIVASRDADFGFARMFELQRGRPHTKQTVFRTLEEARRWLGLEDD